MPDEKDPPAAGGDSVNAEIERLRREVKRLTRQYGAAQQTLDRVKTTAAAKENVNNIFRSELHRQNSYMNLVLEYSPDILLLFDQEDRFLYCADVFLKRTKIPHFGHISGKTFSDVFSGFMPPDGTARLADCFREAVEKKEPVVVEEIIDMGADGHPRNYDILFTPMYDENGGPGGSLVIFHDNTEIFTAIKKAEEASRAKSNFLANMSHEIRTPLNAIIGMTEIAKSTEEADRRDYCLDKIRGASTHLLGVINDILDMSKIEAEKFELSYSEFDFIPMVQGVISVFEFRLEEKKQILNADIAADIPPRIISDKQRFAQVITNLLTNAVKFTPERGTITVKAEKLSADEKYCVLKISVTDTGIGITKEHQEKLFRSFEQADSSVSRKYGGTGLGLAISRRIVDMLGGEIHVESEPGMGSSFIFTVKAETVPSAPEEIHADTAMAETSPLRSWNNMDNQFTGRRILLAEDVDINREIVLTILKPTGLIVDEAENGQQAFERFSASPESYDLILMDIQMPGMSGYEATRLIRNLDSDRARTIPIIAMTANVFREDIEECMKAGMNGHMGKPLDFNELMATLKKYLG